jgi:flagellin-like protein
MRIAKKGVSPVIATLLLILIAVAAAVLLYTWVSGLSANVAGSQVTGKTLTVIQATWAMGDNHANQTVLIISFKAPPAAVGGGGAGSNLLTIDNVDVLYSGRVICHYNGFALSTSDRQHTGSTAGGITGYALMFAGYAGSQPGKEDSSDAYPPGAIFVEVSNTPGDFVSYLTSPPTTKFTGTDNFVTVIAAVWNVQYVSTNRVETYFTNTTATIRFDRWLGTGSRIAVGGTTNEVDTFDLAKVGQDDWSMIIWCKNINPNVMNSVDVRLQFQDGSTWSTTVPLTVQ